MNMTPNDPRTEASTCKSSGTQPKNNEASSGTQPKNNEAWIERIQAITTKETMSTAHMHVYTNKESREKQAGRTPGPKRAQAGQPSPFWSRFDAPFDLAALQTIYSALAKSHGKIHSSSAAEEQRKEGH
jgi:hypothetical protein